MKFTVYGIRLKGGHELRYVGQTAHDPDRRMTAHCSEHGPHSHFSAWIKANRPNVETVKLGFSDTRNEAKAIERVMVAFCLRLNHRLFNRDHVPAHLRVGEGESLAA